MIDLFDMSYWDQYDINKEELLDYLGYIKDIQELGARELKYSEKHHIIPKSVDISFAKDNDNLITLSGREHFIAHQKLLKCFNGKLKSSMHYSYNLMCNSLHNNNYDITPEDYECFREEFHKICVKNNTMENNPRYNQTVSDETRKRQSEAARGKHVGSNNGMFGVHRMGKFSPMFGKKQTENTKIKIGNNSKGRMWVNNGTNNKFIRPEELEYYNSIGFIYRGCLMTKPNPSIKQP